MSHFYSHLIEIESVIIKLDEMDLTVDQKQQLALLVDSTIHHTVLDLILSKLSDEDKKVFLHRLEKNPHDKDLMKFLVGRVEGLEDEIKQAVKELKKELHEDIEEAKKHG